MTVRCRLRAKSVWTSTELNTPSAGSDIAIARMSPLRWNAPPYRNATSWSETAAPPRASGSRRKPSTPAIEAVSVAEPAGPCVESRG